MPFLIPIFTSTITSMVTAFFTQKVIEQCVLSLLKYLSARSTNTVDDKLVALLESAIAEKKKS